ncbi:hypothetical protein J5N97_010066 [Dioscorea zingiberensis]|uniref:non-specific serine/threonine protein kinase n=1 Tax=Dioscorea zingiberensis TaxID=325984 RepID=A0A9D5HMH3_9LILI|nr:hypothetical protein J5N97_010066 [Dioscorea zingiberensis]
MNTTATAIETLNNYRNFTAAVALPILIPVSQLPVFSPPIYKTSGASDVTGRKSRLERTIVILSATLGVALALALWSLLVLLYCKYGHYRRKALALARMGSCLETTDLLHANKKSGGGPDSGQSKAVVDKLLFGVSTYLDNPVVYDIEDIMAATMNLDDRYKIDGSVYKATLNGEVFAVKKARGDITEELAILQKLSHANIVKLRGVSVSTQKDGFFLVFENAENTSLERWLFPKKSCSSNSVTFLSWKQRLNIALDVANGLQYMHSHTRPSIVHRDIKSSNILLNGRFKAKIANFSMAKPATVGVSPSIDVFAFGVLLLELLSGRRDGENVGVLWKEIRMVMEVEEKREERLKKWMDPKLQGFYPVDGAMSLAAMARACTSEKASERPSMSEMVFSLSVLAQSCSNDECERLWVSNTEYKVVMTNPVAR